MAQLTVRAITPRVTAISGHVQFLRDADGIDLWKDEYATGLDIFDAEYLPPRRHGRMFLPPDFASPNVAVSSAASTHRSAPDTQPSPGCSARADSPKEHA